MIPLLLAAAWTAAAPPQAQTPRAFIEQLYASYRDPDYSPFSHPGQVFAPRLAAAIAEDSRLAKGEVGYLDGDPVCQCQDTSGMHASVIRVTALGHGKTAVRVSIGFTGYAARPATFTLVRTRGGWRIADVASADEPSLVKAIEASNRELRDRH